MMLYLAAVACVLAVCQAVSLPWTLLQPAAHTGDIALPALVDGPAIQFQQAWQNFKSQFNKQYNDKDEEAKRQEIFRDNLKKIEMHNVLYDQGQSSFRLGLNEYADMEHKEFVSVMNGYISYNKTASRGSTYLSPNVPLDLPKSVDWRPKGYVTKVKNQLQCGSCWAFSATGSLEGQHYRKTRKLVSLSEQNLVDCSTSYGNKGCNGGNVDLAFAYIKDNGGIDTEQSYPYEAKEAQCRYNPSNVGATVAGLVDVPSGSETKLHEATATVGPISIAIDASHPSFMQYQDGVYIEPICSPTNLDHGVLIVGYGTSSNGQAYWIVKNSWGPTWGKNGYIWMARNRNNQCGVATAASYPLV